MTDVDSALMKGAGMETTVPSEDRAMRVFVSSTSREEFEEREILVKRIFPQHRKLHENGS